MGSPAGKWDATMTATKQGLTYDDYHFKNAATGKHEKSPPSKMKAMYDYLPSETAAGSPKKIPRKLELSGSNPETTLEGLKIQTRCIGVYATVPQKEPKNGFPVYKHVDEDLAIFCTTHEGEACWVVAKFTEMETKEKVSMRCLGETAPFDKAASTWSCFQGGTKWTEAVGIKVKPTYHGYGMEGRGTVANSESSVSPKKGRK